MEKQVVREEFSRRIHRIGLLFTLVVIIPGILLSFLAIRAVSKENAAIEKRMRTTLQAEINTIASKSGEVMGKVERELDSMFAENNGPGGTYEAPLIDVLFLLSPNRTILRPEYSVNLSPAASAFLKYNREFFQDRRAIIKYVRTPLQYESMQKGAAQLGGKRSGTMKESKSLTFRYDEEARVTIDTTESVKFSQLVADTPSGFIPRIIDDDLQLLFWKKASGNRIHGCVVDLKEVQRRIVAGLPQLYSRERIITVLDHNGQPIVMPKKHTVGDWTKPFVTAVISEKLPRWSIASYLADPGVITAQSRFNALVIGLLVAILLLSIIIGGVLAFRSIFAELVRARQRTTFVANVSHELKTPLTSIRLLAEMIKDGRQPDREKQDNYLNIIVSETERLTRLINNVLDFSRADKGTKKYAMETVDIVALCRDVLESQRVRLEYGHFQVKFTADIDKVMVRADTEAIKQALLNLLSNSEKYSQEEKMIELSVRMEGSGCIIDVMDKGIGIKPQHVPLLFGEFYRVDDSLTARVQGTGLGLTITKQIVGDHNGTIRYIRIKPYSSVFRIMLPIVME
jgi:signal transduction histidine kinase